MSRFERGMQRWADRLIANAGVTVTYHRGEASLVLKAIPGSTSFDAASSDGFWSTAHEDDFIVRSADLVIGGAVIRPAAGDWAERVYASQKVTYLVRPLEDDRCYRELPPSAVLLRIHTRVSKREAA